MFKTITIQNTHIINTARSFSLSSALNQIHSKVVIVGGGTGGCSIGAKFTRSLGKNQVTIIEPSTNHYYQPLFTLAGGGLKKVSQSVRKAANVLPRNAKWINDYVVEFNPQKNTVTTKSGEIINYDILLVACGLHLHYEKIPGLVEGLEKYDNIGSIYSPKYVEKTYQAIQKFEKGDTVYTFPNSPVKCPGAPQKICYIHEDYLGKVGKRSKANVTYNTALPVIFGVKTYADALWKVAKARDINVNLNTNLIEVKPDKNEAVFARLDKPGETFTMQYSLLHVTPPMTTPDALHNCKELVNQNGFLTVDKHTLQHTKYPNIFGIGDCTDSPNSKTMAAVAAQNPVVYNNMRAVLDNKSLTKNYDGYASCPLVTGVGKCILAEFDYNLQPLETFPIKQDRELYVMYFFKKTMMPNLYWQLMLNGYWNGPKFVRKLLHLGLKN